VLFEVTDDSGFLALIDPEAYAGFVAPDWDYDSLIAHFRAAMAARTLLIWQTGAEGEWRVEVGGPAPAGFRRTAGAIHSRAGRLHLLNYESLTMAAQFPDVTLPEPHLKHLVLTVEPGDHTVEVVQLTDPDDLDAEPGPGPDFVLTLTPGATLPPWTGPAWSEPAG